MHAGGLQWFNLHSRENASAVLSSYRSIQLLNNQHCTATRGDVLGENSQPDVGD